MNTNRSLPPLLIPFLVVFGGCGVGHPPISNLEPAAVPVASFEGSPEVLTSSQDSRREDSSGLEDLEESIECVKRLSDTFQELSRDVGPAVANVTAHVKTSRGERQLAQGSGVVISPDGLLVTNFHVVSGGKVFRASFDDGREVEAAIVGTDPESDLAFLQLEGDDFVSARLAEREAQVGEFVLALGNPFGMGFTVTSGIVSRLGRRNIGLDVLFEDFIQTNALIYPGNSGGPLIDLHGRVLGLNTAVEERSRRGISYAIPADMIARAKKDIIEVGYVRRGYLGVRTSAVQTSRGGRRSSGNGARVYEVIPDSPAEEFGVEVGDVLLSLEGTAVNSRGDLLQVIGRLQPDKPVELVYVRDGVESKKQITLVQRPRD